jgi:bifunctional enzyme CysN/CysC/sulfate adenylyltransferase subunit 1
MSEEGEIARDVEGWLARHERKQLLRLVTVGSVDDGKSTLIGRLLHDANGVYDDQLASVKRASARGAIHDGLEEGEEIDFSLFTDGLKAEREQGITIDVAYRYFTTARRKYILADTPGHVQYTRNMATGASTADVALILLDARLGVLPQSRRHAHIAALLGIPNLLVCVNKMDLVRFDAAVFEALRDEFAAFAGRLGFRDVSTLPVSARRGDNVVTRSLKTPWYDGPTLLEYLERVPVGAGVDLAPMRFPVQLVLRPHLDYRGFAGQVASGVLRPGDRVRVLPSRRETTVKAIDTYAGEVAAAHAPMSVTVRLADEVDVSRGEMLVPVDAEPRVTDRAVADLVWMSERPLDARRGYLLKHTTRVVPARVERVLGRTDLETLESVPAEGMALNDIGRVVVACARPLFLDAYAVNRVTGAFILIDALTNDTVAAGMFRDEPPPAPEASARRVVSRVGAGERRQRLGHAGAALWVADTGAAARALAAELERALFDAGVVASLVEADAGPAALLAQGLAAAGVVAVCLAPGDDASVDAARLGVGEDAFIRVEDVAGALAALRARGLVG